MFIQNISHEVWGGESGKYRLVDAEGNPVDLTPEDTCRRVATGLANLEENFDHWYPIFSRILLEGKFSGGGRIMANIGAGELKRDASPINCTVLRQIPDSMEGIMQTAKESAMTLRTGAGVGYDFSSIRPRGAYVFGAGAETSGVISFMKIFDAVCSTVMSGGGRRGAQMGCLDIQHPEIETFITCKREDGVLRYFNLSVLITDEFMTAVQNDDIWKLWFWERCEICDEEEIGEDKIVVMAAGDLPFRHPEYDYFRFSSEHTEVLSGNCCEDTIYKKRVFKVLPARELFEQIMTSTYNFAEPGFILIDRVNRENVLWSNEVIRSTNPCVAEGTLVNTPNGYRKVEDIEEGDLISTVLGYEPVKTIETHKNYPVFKIKFSDGGEQVVTAAHRYHAIKKGSQSKKIKKLRLDELNIGDYVRVHSSPNFIRKTSYDYSEFGEYKTGLMKGILLGDGCYTEKCLEKTKKGIIKIASSQDDSEYNSRVKSLFECIGEFSKDDISKISKTLNMVISNGKTLISALNLEPSYSYEKSINVESILSKHEMLGILDGLLATDGTLNLSSNHPQMRFITSSKQLALDIRRLLLYFNAHGRITSSFEKGGTIDGRDIERKHIKYTVNVSGNGLRDYLLVSRIGDIHPEKGKQAEKILSNFICSGNTWKVKILDIEPAGFSNVYDLYCEKSDTWITEGYVQQGCGEQPLPPNASCLLASMILPPYVHNMFTKNALFDWESFEKDIAIATRMMDNVVEVNNLPLEEMREQILAKRRHGLGFTGLGTVFNMMGMAYGDAASQEFAERIAYTIAKVSLFENIALAKEKGCAPIFDTVEARASAIESGYLKRLLNTFEPHFREDLVRQILEHGLRYSHATSIAPTGTMSLTWGNNCSNGIEPSFTNEYARNFRQHGKKTKVQEIVRSLEYQLWIDQFSEAVDKTGNIPMLPDHWRVSDDLSVEDHIVIQAAVQKWVDSAVSKTANVPTDYPFEKFKEIYMMGWKSGLKGVTTFRYNPEAFSGVLVRKEDLENTKYVFILDDNEEVVVSGSDMIEYDGELHNAANLFDALKEGIYGDM